MCQHIAAGMQSTRICNQMTHSKMYDMHGWLREWNTPFVSQQLRYADGANPSYSGRVSAKITGSYGRSDRYDYSYDRLGRLISADFSREMPPNVASKDGNADYSTTYSYDFTTRHQNPAFPHFTTPDPLAEKFKHLSPHLFCAGDPINYIDQNGDSIAVLIEPKGAMSFGHMAILIQNDSGEWELYSKNGTDENFGIYGTSNKDDDEGDTTDPPKTFLHSDKNVDKNKNIKYTEAYVIHTTKEEDNIIREVVKSKIETKKYNLFRDNCAQLVQDGLRSINKPDGSLSPKEKSNKILFRATNLYNIFIEEFSPNKIFQRIKEQIPGVQITINSN